MSMFLFYFGSHSACFGLGITNRLEQALNPSTLHTVLYMSFTGSDSLNPVVMLRIM